MIDEVTQGSLAKNSKLNEVIAYLNSIINVTVKPSLIEGDDGEPDRPGFHITENDSTLIVPGGSGDLPEGFVEQSVTLCVDGSPVEGTILFKPNEE